MRGDDTTLPLADPDATRTVEQPRDLSPGSTTSESLDDLARPERIGPYRIVDLLGEGGMGTVYLAEQDEPVKRRVALKVIRPFRQERAERRFSIECQALADLNHPHIATLYEVGTTDESKPYVAMEWVDGEPITRWCESHRLDLAARLGLFLQVCNAIRHAHGKGILHCDLKPSNILVTAMDGRGTVKVIDFGIARALGEDMPERGQSLDGEVLGSPLYLSPEAFGDQGRRLLDARSDVYSLGQVLYEVLTGALPVDADKLSLWELITYTLEGTQTLPSVRFSGLDMGEAKRLAERRRTTPQRLTQALRGDLDAIVRKATARDPEERYGSPWEMAVDLRRHLNLEPVDARPQTAAYRSLRFVQRRAGVVFSVLLLVLALAGGLVARTLEAHRANTAAIRAETESRRAQVEADRARTALIESKQTQQFLIDLFESADPERSESVEPTVTEVLDRGADRLREELADRPLLRARLLQAIGSIYTKMGDLSRAEGLVTEALELRREHLSTNHPEVLESLGLSGVILRQQGHSEEAREALEGTVSGLEAQPNPDPVKLAQAQSNLGNLYWQLRDYDAAEEAHRSALTLRRRLGHRLDTAESANNLGVLLMGQRRHGEAKPLLLFALEAFTEDLNPRHPRVAATLNNLGLIEQNEPHWAKAQGRFHEAVDIWRESLGESHHQTLIGRINVVNELDLRHRWDEALVEALDLVETSRNSSAIYRVQALRKLGSVQRQAGQKDAALKTYNRAVALAREAFGEDHAQVSRTQTYMTWGLAEQGRFDEAHALLSRVADRQRDLEPTHSSRIRTDNYFGHIHLITERYAEAEIQYRSVLERREARGARQLTIAYVLYNLARSPGGQGRHEEAVELYHRTLGIREPVFGVEHPYVADVNHHLGLTEKALGRYDRAREHLERAVAVRRAVYPADDGDLRESVEALASLP